MHVPGLSDDGNDGAEGLRPLPRPDLEIPLAAEFGLAPFVVIHNWGTHRSETVPSLRDHPDGSVLLAMEGQRLVIDRALLILAATIQYGRHDMISGAIKLRDKIRDEASRCGVFFT